MRTSDILIRRRIKPKHLAISLLVLAACLAFPVVFYLDYFDSGFSVNSRWVVIEVTLCDDHPEMCEDSEAELQIGDHITKYAGFTSEDFETNRALSPFGGTKPGDIIEISFLRDNVPHVIDWQIPFQNPFTRLIALIAPIFVFGPFWIAGTAILSFMRPRSQQRLLFILMNYLTALWLATGIYSNFRVLYSSLFLHATSWIMLPVFIHFHLIVPSSLIGKRVKTFLMGLYAIAFVMAVLEILVIPPQYVYYISILLICLGSIGLLIYRLSKKDSPSADRNAAQLMLIGIALAFLPGLLIWMVPTILNLDPPGVFATSVAMLALPMLPMFYTYALFKRRLGDFEVRLNRLLAMYSVFIIYLLILSVALFFRASLETSSSTFFGFYFLVILAVGLAVFPLRDYFGKQINRFAYGSKFDPEDIFHIYATDIPAAMDRAILAELLTSEILPPLRIHQSMLLIKNGEDYESLFSYGIEEDNQELSIHEVNALKSASGVYLPPMVQGNWEENQTGSPEWVRLALMLERHTQEIGLWLFGVRDPDDFYSQKDINLLHDFAEQVAIAVESMRLFETVKNELIERQQAEETLQNYAGRLELLHGIDQAILEVSSSKEIAQAALNGLQKLIPFSMGSIIYFDLQTGRREVLALVGSEQSLIDSANIDLAAILSESIDLRARQVWSNNDVPGDLETKPYLKPAFEVGLRSVLSAPLMISGEINGLLNLGTDIVSGFKPEHSEIVLEVANTISVAIHSAMLLETVTSHSNELKRLSARLINIQEEERKHISIELHDEIGQVLTALTYNLAAIRRDMPPSRSPELIERLSDSDQLVHQVMNRIRDISLQLRPSMLHDLGLVPTLRSYISDYGERMNLAVEFTADALVYPLDEDVETALYRVVQEGLTNVARHAHAKTVAVSLLCSEETVTATVEDDGIGFDTDSPRAESNLSNGTGLLGIRERLAPLGGEFEIHSNIGQGTVLVARIPVRKQDEED